MTTSRSERPCVRGCVEVVHYAVCPAFGPRGREATCTGECETRVSEARYGALLCSRCFGRIRGVLLDAPDVVGRMRSASDQAKAVVYQPAKVLSAAGAAKAPEQSPADVIDAIRDVLVTLRAWATTVDSSVPFVSHRGFTDDDEITAAAMYSEAILGQLDVIANDAARGPALHHELLERHEETTVSGRVWSLADARARWGAERRDDQAYVYPASDDDHIVERQPVTEWHDPLLTIQQAAKRVDRSQRTVEIWIEKEELAVAVRVRLPDGTTMKSVYASAVDAVAARKRPGRPRRVSVPAISP